MADNQMPDPTASYEAAQAWLKQRMDETMARLLAETPDRVPYDKSARTPTAAGKMIARMFGYPGWLPWRPTVSRYASPRAKKAAGIHISSGSSDRDFWVLGPARERLRHRRRRVRDYRGQPRVTLRTPKRPEAGPAMVTVHVSSAVLGG